MNRPRYKDLYITEGVRAAKATQRAERAERELARLDSVLASYGQTILEHVEDRSGDIELAPIAYEAATAFIRTLAPSFLDHVVGWHEYRWRGRRIVRAQP